MQHYGVRVYYLYTVLHTLDESQLSVQLSSASSAVSQPLCSFFLSIFSLSFRAYFPAFSSSRSIFLTLPVDGSSSIRCCSCQFFPCRLKHRIERIPYRDRHQQTCKHRPVHGHDFIILVSASFPTFLTEYFHSTYFILRILFHPSFYF